MNFEIDLHIHTNASNDGSLTPEEIIDKAIVRGMKTIAITDHNTCKGSIQAIKYLKKHLSCFNLITGIEIDCVYKGINLHVLGYGIDPFSTDIDELEKYMNKIEFEAGLKRIEKIEEIFNISLDKSDLINNSSEHVVTGEAIAENLLTTPKYNNFELLKPYRNTGNRADNPFVNFYWDFCSQGKAAYIQMELISLEKAIEIIEKNGGIPILAHPENNLHGDTALLTEIIHKGVKGIEAISSYHTIEQIGFYMDKAKELNVIVTCGTDFHGKTKPSIELGVFNYNISHKSIYEGLKGVIGNEQ